MTDRIAQEFCNTDERTFECSCFRRRRRRRCSPVNFPSRPHSRGGVGTKSVYVCVCDGKSRYQMDGAAGSPRFASPRALGVRPTILSRS